MIRSARLGCLLWVVLLSPVCALPPAVVWADETSGKKYALVIGVRRYDSSKFTELKYSENDAEELAKVLSGEAGFSQVRVLSSTRGDTTRADAPTVENIRAAVKALLGKKRQEDTVLVALSGHGIQARVKEKEESFFCPADAQLNDNATLVGLGGLLRDLDACGAGVKLLLVDACRDEPASGRNVDVDSLPRMPRGTAALFSCKSGERAFETAKLGKGHGVFFYHVLQGLKGEAKNKRGEITWSSLADHVIDKVSDETPALIGGHAKQTPELKVNLTGKSPVLVRSSEAARLLRLARQHHYGQGRKIDLVEAADLYRQADEKGHPLAAGFLGMLYFYGIGVKKNEAMAGKLCLAAAVRVKSEAVKGNVVAQHLMGFMCENGKGVERDEKGAVGWFRKAAEQGYAPAQNNLGKMYANGKGVEKDGNEALVWFRKAADTNLPHAQCSIGWVYAYGKGVEKDDKEAVRWFRKAANQGHDYAQNQLGIMYDQGKGVEKDKKEAMRWFRLAADQGNPFARDRLDKLR